VVALGKNWEHLATYFKKGFAGILILLSFYLCAYLPNNREMLKNQAKMGLIAILSEMLFSGCHESSMFMG
jgi:hypothetical protein